jgi:hypothetical protein
MAIFSITSEEGARLLLEKKIVIQKEPLEDLKGKMVELEVSGLLEGTLRAVVETIGEPDEHGMTPMTVSLSDRQHDNY